MSERKSYRVLFQYSDDHEEGEYAVVAESKPDAAYQVRQHVAPRKIKITSINED